MSEPAALLLPIAWPDHPLAVSGGEILAARILPLLGHNARDFARAAAVCRGWRAACRAATAALSRLYWVADLTEEDAVDSMFLWSPCGKLVAAITNFPPRIFMWRASTGAVHEWSIEAPPSPIPAFGGDDGDDQYFEIAFSRDSGHVLTCFRWSTQFAVWSVPDGRLVAIHRGQAGGPPGGGYTAIDFASTGLIALAATTLTGVAVDLWTVDLLAGGGDPTEPIHHHQIILDGYGELDVVDEGSPAPRTLAFSPDGSKFAFAFSDDAYVFDVASHAQLGTYRTHSPGLASTSWSPDGSRVLVAWDRRVCIWDFNAPGPSAIITADFGPDLSVIQWSPTTCYTGRKVGDDTWVEKWRLSDRSLVLSLNAGPNTSYMPYMHVSPDESAIIIHAHDSARVFRF